MTRTSWNQFVQQYATVGRSLTEGNTPSLLRLVQARQLMELAHNTEIDLASEPKSPYSDRLRQSICR